MLAPANTRPGWNLLHMQVLSEPDIAALLDRLVALAKVTLDCTFS
jgi:hypothetical protein